MISAFSSLLMAGWMPRNTILRGRVTTQLLFFDVGLLVPSSSSSSNDGYLNSCNNEIGGCAFCSL